MKKEIFERLMSLSKKHLKATREDNWELWESIAAQKEKCYRQLLQFEAGYDTAREKVDIVKIQTLEKETRRVLDQKREESKQALIRFRQKTSAIETYRKSRRSVSDRHFGIKC